MSYFYGPAEAAEMEAHGLGECRARAWIPPANDPRPADEPPTAATVARLARTYRAAGKPLTAAVLDQWAGELAADNEKLSDGGTK